MARINSFIFSAFIYCISATLVFAQSAALLPNAQQVYLDNNGNPLATGTVSFYYPSTLNLKPIWQDANESVVYTNPVTLNSAGRPPGSQGIYGQGAYRQIVKDVNGNTIWDALTSSAGSSSGTAATGDGDLVGTVKPWAGITAPNQYQFAYGQQLNRTTFAALFTAITQSLAVTCTSASNTLSGIADTTSINIGAPLEAAACVVPGTTVSSKTSSTVVMSNPSSVNLNTTAVFFPFGNGDGSTTFTLPDFRGNTIAGRQNMGGTASTNLTNCNAGQGTTCGNQNTTLARANLPNVAPTATSIFTGTPVTPSVSSTGTFLVATGGTGTSVLTGGGGAINQATLAFNAITPAGTIATTVQSLNGGVTQTVFSNVQPTITLNYIIKVTPDTNSAIATGVTDINGMVGSIACGAGLSCTGNTITVTASTCAINGAFLIYNSTSAAYQCSTTAATGATAIMNGITVAGTSGAARSLNVGSNFVAAQPAVFNVNDNQSPANSNLCYFGTIIPGGAVNGGFLSASCGTSSNPVTWPTGSLSLFSATFDAGVSGRSYNGEWHNYTMSAGTGGGIQGLLVYATMNGTWTPSGAGGAVGINAYANTIRGGFTWGMVPTAAANGVTAANIVGTEIDTQYAAGASGIKVGLQIVDQLNNTTGTSTIAATNTALQIITSHTAYGWDTGLLFPAGDGSTVDYPIRTTGTLIKSGAGTFAHGIDISAGTCSTDCWKSNGITIDGSGNVATSVSVKSSGATAGIGYATGAGGTITQATNKTTGVILNTISGAITMNNAALAAATIVSFTLTDSAIAATDVLILNHISGGTVGSYTLNAQAAAGTATINVRNNTAGSLSEAIVIQFAIIKAVNG